MFTHSVSVCLLFFLLFYSHLYSEGNQDLWDNGVDLENEIWIDEDSNVVLIGLTTRNHTYSIRNATYPEFKDAILEAYIDYEQGDKIVVEYMVFLTKEVFYLVADDRTAFPAEQLISIERAKVRDLVRNNKLIRLPAQRDIESSFFKYTFNGWEQNCHGWALLCTTDPLSHRRVKAKTRLWISNEMMTEIMKHENLTKVDQSPRENLQNSIVAFKKDNVVIHTAYITPQGHITYDAGGDVVRKTKDINVAKAGSVEKPQWGINLDIYRRGEHTVVEGLSEIGTVSNGFRIISVEEARKLGVNFFIEPPKKIALDYR